MHPPPPGILVALVPPLLICATARAQQVGPPDGDERVAEAWAGPDMLRNPVAMTIDPWGNVYLAETDRADTAVVDTRDLAHLNAVEEDLKLRFVEDRLALIDRWIDEGHFAPDAFTRAEDRVRLLADSDADGRADLSTVFAGGFNDPLDGIAAGVLWHEGRVYFTNVPHLWLLEDTDADHVADRREPISSGYGIRWAFTGHDLHGPTLGPDGRIYFSMGDRGYNVRTLEGERLVGVDRGAVFRCFPDGSGLEIVHQGLRNPQDLTFDEFGNWFTGDNNSDSGDRARIVHVVEGGDSGWRQDLQSLESRGPWNREHVWKLPTDPDVFSRPAWALPPVGHVGAGPSGIAYYPGTGENPDSDDTIYMVDFYGTGSTIHRFRCVPDGAGFRIEDRDVYYKGVTVTDLAWGYDGRLYLCDWGGGWSPNDKGNVFTIANRTLLADPGVRARLREMRRLLTGGLDDLTEDELAALLAHPDQRLRLAAQHRLAGRAAPDALAPFAHDPSAPLVQRVHAIWGLWELGLAGRDVAALLRPLLEDPEAHVRVQTAKVMGDLRLPAPEAYLRLLSDESPQARSFGAIALGRTGERSALEPLLHLLDRSADRDATLRHAAAYALSLIADPDELASVASRSGAPARLGAVLALRRLAHPAVVAFLTDPAPAVAVEAARAIYDRRIEAALPALGAMLGSDLPAPLRVEPFLRRAIEANRLLATPRAALRLVHLAASPAFDAPWRELALTRLVGWERPLRRDGVWGRWIDLPPASLDEARADLARSLPDILAASAASETLAPLAMSLEAALSSGLDADGLTSAALDASGRTSARAFALERLLAEAPSRAASVAGEILAQRDAPSSLRVASLDVLISLDVPDARAHVESILAGGPIAERKLVIDLLARTKPAWGGGLLAPLARALGAGSLAPELRLEVHEAIERLQLREPPLPFASLESRPPSYADELLQAGGDPEEGRRLFRTHPAAQCFRCHMVGGEGGLAAPDLTQVASRLTTPRLIESIVEPQAVIVPGFLSAMPAMTDRLTPRETRDLVAYLQTLHDPAIGPADHRPARADSRRSSSFSADGAHDPIDAERFPLSLDPVLVVFAGAVVFLLAVVLVPVLLLRRRSSTGS